jgi:hypothetical protein
MEEAAVSKSSLRLVLETGALKTPSRNSGALQARQNGEVRSRSSDSIRIYISEMNGRPIKRVQEDEME